MSRNTYQKVSSGGRPIVNQHGLPVFTRNIKFRMNVVRDMLTIGLTANEAKWSNIQSDIKML